MSLVLERDGVLGSNFGSLSVRENGSLHIQISYKLGNVWDSYYLPPCRLEAPPSRSRRSISPCKRCNAFVRTRIHCLLPDCWGGWEKAGKGGGAKEDGLDGVACTSSTARRRTSRHRRNNNEQMFARCRSAATTSGPRRLSDNYCLLPTIEYAAHAQTSTYCKKSWAVLPRLWERGLHGLLLPVRQYSINITVPITQQIYSLNKLEAGKYLGDL